MFTAIQSSLIALTALASATAAATPVSGTLTGLPGHGNVFGRQDGPSGVWQFTVGKGDTMTTEISADASDFSVNAGFFDSRGRRIDPVVTGFCSVALYGQTNPGFYNCDVQPTFNIPNPDDVELFAFKSDQTVYLRVSGTCFSGCGQPLVVIGAPPPPALPARDYGYSIGLSAWNYDTQTGSNPVATLATNPPAFVPEPAALALFGLGIVGVAAARRRK